MWIKEARGQQIDLNSLGIPITLVPFGIVQVRETFRVKEAICRGLIKKIEPIFSPADKILGYKAGSYEEE